MDAPYFLIANFLAFFLAFLVLKNRPWGSKKENDQFAWRGKYIFLVIVFFFIGAIRPVIEGTDNAGYLAMYEYVKNYGELPLYLKNTEYGYAFTNLVFGRFLDLPYYIFFGLLTALTWSIYIASSYRYQFLLPWMLFFSITNGFLFWSFNGIRQSLAIVVFLFSIKYILEKRLLSYIFVIMLASLFHFSVLLLLPLYFFANIKFERKIWFPAYLGSVLFMGSSFMTSFINEAVVMFFKFISYFSIYERYVSKEGFLSSTQSVATDSGLGILLNIFATIFIIFYSDKTLAKLPNLNFYLLLFSISSILSNLLFSIELVGRLLSYFSILFGLLMSATIYSLNKKKSKLAFFMFFAIYTALFIKLTFSKFG